MRKYTYRSGIFKFFALLGVVATTIIVINACNKEHGESALQTTSVVANHMAAPVVQTNNTISQVVTVMNIIKAGSGSAATTVYFRENEEVFTVTDTSLISQLQSAYNTQSVIKITINPWTATVLGVTNATTDEVAAHGARTVNAGLGAYQRVNLASADPVLTGTSAMAELNTTTPGLTNVIPDMATAQAIFDYISHQCCVLPGPYQVDYCIPFQYVIDGCYARAHKMCWIINNLYHYSTHKLFSFSYSPSVGYQLSVKAEKWGGCCVNWWYHVAPLVNIKTTTGVQAYIFDPGMFDQPVPYTTWLHAQQNPACSSLPMVTSINLQPTSSYAPNDTATFITDPTYSQTDMTLSNYAHLVTCP